MGNHTVRLAIVGRDATAAAYTITADVFTLRPDNTAPVINASCSNLKKEATGPDGAVVTFSATATDDLDGSVPVTFDPPSGSLFALGGTPIIGTAKDFMGNTATVNCEVIVVDTTPPTLTLPGNLLVEATSHAGAAVTFPAGAHDIVSGNVDVGLSQQSGSIFPLGVTVVRATAQDDFENVATGSFTVTVVDTSAPVIESLTASPNVLWPPNHKMVLVSLTAQVADLVDTAPATRIISVASNEPENGSDDGDTAPDWEITGALTLNLRAERAGDGLGRVYTITVESRDRTGNASTRTVEVRVPL